MTTQDSRPTRTNKQDAAPDGRGADRPIDRLIGLLARAEVERYLEQTDQTAKQQAKHQAEPLPDHEEDGPEQ